TLGVAVVGSVFSSVYGPKLVEGLQGLPIPGPALAAAKESMAAAVAVAHQAPAQAQPVISHAAQSAFMDGLAFGSPVPAAARAAAMARGVSRRAGGRGAAAGGAAPELAHDLDLAAVD